MFVPRPVTAKRKSETNLTQPSASLSSSATVTSSSSSTPNSNSLISQLLRPAPNLTAEKAKTESPGFVAFEEAYSKLGLIAKSIAHLGTVEDKKDREIYAISYGLLLMSATIERTKQFHSSNYGNNLQTLETKYGFDGRMSRLSPTLQDIENVRVLLADHFIRIPSTKFQSLFNLQDDLGRLSVLAVKNSNVKIDYDTGLCAQLHSMSSEADNIKKLTVSHMDRFAYILSSIKCIQNIKAEAGQENNTLNNYAMSMLYVIAGTCARELTRSNDIDLKNYFENNKDSEDLKEALVELSKIRNTLAHDVSLTDPVKLKQFVFQIIDAEYIEKLSSYTSKISVVLDKPYAEKFLIAPPATTSSREDSVDEKISTIRKTNN